MPARLKFAYSQSRPSSVGGCADTTTDSVWLPWYPRKLRGRATTVADSYQIHVHTLTRSICALYSPNPVCPMLDSLQCMKNIVPFPMSIQL